MRVKPQSKVKPKKVSTDVAAIQDLRMLKKLILNLQISVDRLLRQHGSMTKDLADIRKESFTKSLEKSMKNKDKLKKEFDEKDDPLLNKCGVKKKILDAEDIERIKSRYKLEE
jgi:hypothetical protein